jgi:hypothetical protein
LLIKGERKKIHSRRPHQDANRATSRTKFSIICTSADFPNESISQVPETPIWLLSRGRIEEAERALCWLRGWVTPEVVKEEFNELMKYSNTTKRKKSVTTPMIQFTTVVSGPFKLPNIKYNVARLATLVYTVS